MGRFNQTAASPTRTVNKAGGQAYKQGSEMELVSTLLTSFANDQFYEKATQTFDRIKGLIEAIPDKMFVAKAIVYARTVIGMRSITHVAASELAKHISGEPWAKSFFSAVINRPDDMMEIMAYHIQKNGKVPNSMKKGFALAFNKFDGHALAKYRGDGKSFKLVDIVNLVHPRTVSSNHQAIGDLVKGTLKSSGTWESELTTAGQNAENDTQKAELKKEAWANLINTGKIGYFALLKNLRNIIQQAPESLDKALDLLVDEKRIKNSLVLPFRFTVAYEEILKLNEPNISKVLIALSKAVDISVSNVPKFEGKTLVVQDVSMSMSSNRVTDISSLFSAVLVKASNADYMEFDGAARYKNVNIGDSTMTIAKSMKYSGGNTNFHSIFETARGGYDRIVILSDMQGWVGHHSPAGTFEAYKKRTSSNPFVYSFDLKNYGSLQFPEDKVLCVAGFSDKVLQIMQILETDRNAMINEIKKIQF